MSKRIHILQHISISHGICALWTLLHTASEKARSINAYYTYKSTHTIGGASLFSTVYARNWWERNVNSVRKRTNSTEEKNRWNGSSSRMLCVCAHVLSRRWKLRWVHSDSTQMDSSRNTGGAEPENYRAPSSTSYKMPGRPSDLPICISLGFCTTN